MRNLSQTERAIMTALNAHITRNEEVSLTELAEECHVAKSTVVKAIKRLGFKGYREFTYNYRISRDIQRGTLLPLKVIDGDDAEVMERLVDTLDWCAGKKSIVFCDGKLWAPLLADYVSRKLALFDIFAPASYDYAMVTESRMACGAAFFFFHHLHSGEEAVSSGIGEGMVETVRAHGFRTVVFADGDETNVSSYADVLVRIADDAGADLDLFATKVIMVFERALAGLSRYRAEGRGAS